MNQNRMLRWLKRYTAVGSIIFTSLIQGMNISGPYDFNNNHLNDLVLFGKTGIHIVEIAKDGEHLNLWEYKTDNQIIKDVLVHDIQNDQQNELIILTEYLPGSRNTEQQWIRLFNWKDSTFVEQDLDLKDRSLLYVNNVDADPLTNIVSIAVGTPVREAVLLKFQEEEENIKVSLLHVSQPDQIQNGYGAVYTNFLHVEGIPFLVVFSPEKNRLNVVIFHMLDTLSVYKEAAFPLDSSSVLIGQGIQKTDLDGNGTEEIQLPFADGKIQSLTFFDQKLVLNNSSLNNLELFEIPESADALAINALIASRLTAGLYRIRKTTEYTATPEDTILLGDTLRITVLNDSTGILASFNWLAVPPKGAAFDPVSGVVSWIPRRENIGNHIFRFLIGKKINDQLISDTDEIGDRHQIIPVLEKKEVTYSVVVLDSVLPPTIYFPPPAEPYSVHIITPIKDPMENRYIFEGEPSYKLEVKNIHLPQFPLTEHTISANLNTAKANQWVRFEYTEEPDSGTVLYILKVVHDLIANHYYMEIEPAYDSSMIELNPPRWKNELANYPVYNFKGFPESMRMDNLENGIELFQSETAPKTKKNSYISIVSPLRENRHKLSMLCGAINLWKITGNVEIDTMGNKTLTTDIVYSGELNILNMNSAMFKNEENKNLFQEFNYPLLQHSGTDSVATVSSRVEF